MDILTYALCNSKIKNVEELIHGLTSVSFVISDTVPTVQTAEKNKIYLVDLDGNHIYTEYILTQVDGQDTIVQLGDMGNLDNYYTSAEVDTLLTNKQNKLTWDAAITQNSENAVKSGVIYTALANLIASISQAADGTLSVTTYDGTAATLNGPLAANKVSYVNTTSQLTATTIQAAVDELKQLIENSMVELTQAQYDTLPQADKMNGAAYFITDQEAEGDFSYLEQRLNAMETALKSKNPTVGNLVDEVISGELNGE